MKMQYFTARHEGQTRKVLFEDHKQERYDGGLYRQLHPGDYTYRAEWANPIIDWRL